MIILYGAIIAAAIYYALKIYSFNQTSYKVITHNSYFSTMNDSGKRGEYEIYRLLKDYEKQGYKFLFNVYLPKADSSTTELDVIMIAKNCVFVFESKNYSGWIFGNDNQKNWTQVLPTGRGKGKSQKEYFYNPVWQNRSHCNVLREHLPQGTIIHSVVLFSNKCVFKDLTINAPDVIVAYRNYAKSIIEDCLQHTTAINLDIMQVYERIFPYSQTDESEKQAHINGIRSPKQ